MAAGAALLIGLLSLSESWLHLNLHIDELLFKIPPAVLFQDEWCPPLALRLILVGLALLAMDVETRGKRVVCRMVGGSVGFISMLALVGYVYGVRSIYGIPGPLKLSWQDGIGFMVLSTGLLLSRPEAGLMTVLSSSSLGGRTARRLLPAALVIPLGWAGYACWGFDRGLYSRSIAGRFFSFHHRRVRSARLVERPLVAPHRQRTAAGRADILKFSQELEDRVTQRTAQLETLNRQLEAEVLAASGPSLDFAAYWRRPRMPSWWWTRRAKLPWSMPRSRSYLGTGVKSC